MRKCSFNLARLFVCFFFSAWVNSSIGGRNANGEDFKHYPKDAAETKQLCEAVEDPSSFNRRVASLIIGRWEYVPELSSDLSNITLQSLLFKKDGSVEYSYELKDEKEIVTRTGSYNVIHKGSHYKGPGTCPNVVIKRQDLGDNSVIVFVGVSAGLDCRFHMDTMVLKFADPDGNQFVFVRPMTEEDDAQMTGPVTVPEKKAGRIPNPAVTKEVLAILKEGNLTDHERNNSILRLMNEGDASCTPVLIQHLTDNYPPLIQQTAIRALGKIADKRAVAPLLSILEKPVKGDITDEEEDDEAVLRRNAVFALADIGDASALPVLRKLMKEENEYQSVREFAEIAIREIEAKQEE